MALPVRVPDGRVVLSLRPWQVALSPGRGAIGGDVVRSHRAGAHLRIAVRVGSQTIETLAPAGSQGFGPGCRVALDLSAARVFPAE